MQGGKSRIERYGTPISLEQFKELRDYAHQHGIKLSGFRHFAGDISVIKTIIDDIHEIAADFPDICDKKRGIWLCLDYDLEEEFATTMSGHMVHLNPLFFSDYEKLRKDYEDGVVEDRFVKGTDWRAISRHEVGHVVAWLYHIDSMDLSMDLMDIKSRDSVLMRLMSELSIYSAEYDDGREIIAECFSGYYSRAGNIFAENFVKKCIELSRKGGGSHEIMERSNVLGNKQEVVQAKQKT